MFWAEIWKHISFFLSENFQFLEVKLSIYLNRRVLVISGIVLHICWSSGNYEKISEFFIWKFSVFEGEIFYVFEWACFRNSLYFASYLLKFWKFNLLILHVIFPRYITDAEFRDFMFSQSCLGLLTFISSHQNMYLCQHARWDLLVMNHLIRIYTVCHLAFFYFWLTPLFATMDMFKLKDRKVVPECQGDSVKFNIKKPIRCWVNTIGKPAVILASKTGWKLPGPVVQN